MGAHIMRLLLIALAGTTAFAAAAQPAETWKQPLDDKAWALEDGIVAKHNILGLYPSMVQIPEPGCPMDISTQTPFSDIAHAVCWTANHLAGASFRYVYLRDTGAPAEQVRRARQRADELFEAVWRCQRVTPVTGHQARGYFLGHGPAYEERYGSRRSDEWHQGEADGQDFRWRGDPSHHNYSDSVHGLIQYYTLAAEGGQKDRARQAIDDLVSYWVDNDYLIHKLDRSRQPVPILGWTDSTRLNTRVMMVIAAAKYAHHATGKAKFERVYNDLIERYNVRGLESFQAGKDFDDGEHVFCHLEVLFRLEDDPELLAAYRVVADGLWENFENDGQSLFTYIYYHIAPDAPGREKALAEALQALKTWPTDMTLRPVMSSLDPDLQPPYPVYAAKWDNEYIWKGNLIEPDGWLSRIVTDVAVSPEDPMVVFATDVLGDLYMSTDGARSTHGWRPIDHHLQKPVRAIDVGRKSRIIAVATDDGFYLTTTAGGLDWKRLPVGHAGTPGDVRFDRRNPNVLYAVATGGVWRSVDHGEEYLGEVWEPLTDGLPPARGDAHFTLGLGGAGRIYARFDNALFTRGLDETEWTRAAAPGIGDYAETYPWIVVDPTDADHAWAGIRSDLGGQGTRSLLQETTDGGMTWSNGRETIMEAYGRGGMAAVAAMMTPHAISEPAVDPRTPSTLYAGIKGGVLKSTDSGASWKLHDECLDIPWAHTVFVPHHGDHMFAGTPAGLFASRAGETWRHGHLVLQFDKNTHRELGGAAYIDAYYRGLHYGFIPEAMRTARWWEDE
jgi:photosystem II stability/assembly factor-like uncharacterized protein